MVYSIQMLRGLAAMMVFFSHIPQTILPQWMFVKGAIGVDLFFIISGFIMAYSLKSVQLQGVNSFFDFISRRFIRIYPTYAILSFLILLFGYFTQGTADVGLWLKSIPLIPFADDKGVLVYPFISAAWTLSFEIYYYFLIGLLLAVQKYSIKNTVIITFFHFILGHVIKSKFAIIETVFSPMLIEFAMGAVISHFYFSSRILITSKALRIIFMLFSAAAFFILKNGIANGYRGVYEGLNIQYLDGLYSVPRWIAFGIPSAIFLISILQFEAFFQKGKKYFWPFLILGNASYCLYLTHIFLVGQIMPKIPSESAVAWLFVTSIVIVISISFYYLIEKPILILHKNFGVYSMLSKLLQRYDKTLGNIP